MKNLRSPELYGILTRFKYLLAGLSAFVILVQSFQFDLHTDNHPTAVARRLAGRAMLLSGKVYLLRNDGSGWTMLEQYAPILEGDLVRSDENSYALIEGTSGRAIFLGEESLQLITRDANDDIVISDKLDRHFSIINSGWEKQSKTVDYKRTDAST